MIASWGLSSQITILMIAIVNPVLYDSNTFKDTLGFLWLWAPNKLAIHNHWHLVIKTWPTVSLLCMYNSYLHHAPITHTTYTCTHRFRFRSVLDHMLTLHAHVSVSGKTTSGWALIGVASTLWTRRLAARFMNFSSREEIEDRSRSNIWRSQARTRWEYNIPYTTKISLDKNFAKPSYFCIAEIFCGIYFRQCGKGPHILNVMINTGQKIHAIKISPIRADCEIGETFLLAKISAYAVDEAYPLYS